MAFSKEDRAIGCMIGGAYGDCLGAAVEFMTLDQIRAQYGERGIHVPAPAYGFPDPVITDDTQMAIATAKGILRTPIAERAHEPEILRHVWDAYQEWYRSQGNSHESRAPGSTCMSALAAGIPGSPRNPVNHSAGCGGIMRAHPVGIAYWGHPIHAFALGVDTAALTHGHPNGYVPSGVLAGFIASIMQGTQYDDALQGMLECMVGQTPHFPDGAMSGTFGAIREAISAPTHGDHGQIIDAHVGRSVFGKEGGWLGHDALAISLYAVHVAPDDPIEAVRIAVNHSGDSDSTGSIVGAIMGARFGAEPFEQALAARDIQLERHDELVALGRALVDARKVGT